MRSPEPWVLAGALLFGGAGALAQAQAQTPAPPAAPAMSASAVMAAASAVEGDPLMGHTEKSKTLRLKDKHRDKPPDANELNWWVHLITNLSAGLRVALWLVMAALFVAALLRLRDWLKRRRGGPTLAPLAPTHIGSLDIRPASLPDDIGAAAAALLERRETRAALSLLYRGALSRLVHAHRVPIRAASTERECVALALPHLAAGAHRYLAELVSAWQAVAYAHREPPADELAQLCRGFDAALPAAAATAGGAA